MEEFNVRLERFVGPYTKLLEMIESSKLSITEIGLSAVADDYIAYIKSLQDEEHQNVLIDISQFIVVASTLMLMKAKSLLPGIIYTEEEEKQVHNLEHKLELYASLNKASLLIKKIFLKSPLLERKRSKYKNLVVFLPDQKITKENFYKEAIGMLSSFSPREQVVRVAVTSKIRIEEVIESLLSRIKNQKMTSFLTLTQSGGKFFEEQKRNIVISFLALLELTRLGHIDLNQNENGGDIEIVVSQ